MSSRIAVGALVGLTMLVAASNPAYAQQSEAELLSRIDSLRLELEDARVEVVNFVNRNMTEGAAERRAATRTFEVGPFRVMAPTEQVELAAEIFESVWREDFHAITGSPSLRRSIFTFEWWRTRPLEVYTVAMMDESGLVVRRIELARAWVLTREALRSHVRDAVWAALRDDFPIGTPMRSWLADIRYVGPEDAYRSLAMIGTGASRSCLAGDVAACSATLRLSSPAPASLAEWFTSAQRQALVRRATQPWTARIDRLDPAVVTCLDRDDIAACDAVLATIDWAADVPTDTELLVSALWHAVSVGGEGAWGRAIQDPSSSPRAILERASGLRVDSLVAHWRASLIERRPAVHAGLGRTAAVVLSWILILAGLAMRSTRWRLA
jgi:hypothetical protein